MSFLDKLKTKAQNTIIAIFADEKTRQERIDICNACPELNHSLRQCRVCLCFVDAKTKLKSSACPERKWHPVFDTTI